MKYAVVIEQGPDRFDAHVPDLPGCKAVASTRFEVLELIQQAIDLHLNGQPEPDHPSLPRFQAQQSRPV